MKVCYVCCEYPPALHGGIGTYIQTLSRSLVKEGEEVRVAGVYPSRFNLPEFEEDRGVGVWRMPDPEVKFSWIAARYRLFRLIRDWAASGEIDLVEVPDWEGYAALWPDLGVPVVVRLHGSLTYFAQEMGYPIGRRDAWLESKSFHRAEYCCSTSSYTAKKTQDVFGTHAANTAVLYCPVDMPTPHAAQVERDPNQVVFAGSLTRKKGIIQLIKAWPNVIAAAPSARLAIYGKDAGTDEGTPMIPYLESLLTGPAAESVKFYGHIRTEELREIYRTCAAAVFPSYSEAFSLAPVEAMSAGCPVVYSTMHSGPELLLHGEQGLLVNPDREDELAKAILLLLENRSLADRLGAAGERHVRTRFAAGRVLETNRSYYRQCIEEFRRSRSN